MTSAEPTLIAMHMSDGLINAQTSVLFIIVAALGVSIAIWKARTELDERTAPMAGLVAAFIFAVQMVNFPILPGVSGHLLGGALAAILVGPCTGLLCVSIVLIVQALLFADGGLTALGANITNMAVIGVFVGYGVALVLRPVLLRKEHLQFGMLGGLSFTAALCGTVAASMGFVIEYAIGGQGSSVGSTSLGAVAAYMLGAHLLIGVGEGVITAVTVIAVAKTRPDLVYLLRTAPRGLAVRS